mgnify:FL=1
MSEWKIKRTWEIVAVQRSEVGFLVTLDDQPIITPAKNTLLLPSSSLANRVANEWKEQNNEIIPAEMPFTRLSNSAIDKVSSQFKEVADILSEFGETDLFYYRASSPAELVEKQKIAWDPFLDWVNTSMNVRINVSSGVMFIDQDDDEMVKLKAPIYNMTPFQLAGFHEIVTISGSLIGAYAFVEKAFTADQVWSASRIDEEWQIEQWGSDEEAMATSEKKHHDFKVGCKFFQLSS